MRTIIEKFKSLSAPIKISIGFGVAALALLGASLIALDYSEGEQVYEETTSRSTASIFDSRFWLDGTPDPEDIELTSDFARLLSTTNPRSGRYYTELEAKKIQYLAGRFPDNDLIPRPDILGHQEQLAEKATLQKERGKRITANKTSEQEIADYYDRTAKLYEDHIQLLDYVDGAEKLPPADRERIGKMLKESRSVRAQLEERKKVALDIWRRQQAGLDEKSSPGTE